MLVSLKFPSLGYGLICCALLLYLRPELAALGSEDAAEVPSSSASPPQCEQETIVR
jgi:hypothetical protein